MQGFYLPLILSNLPNDPRWEVPQLPTEETPFIHHLLSQKFTFLGSGGWCFAFLGEDGKTVLKFYKHTHLTLTEILKDFSFNKLLLHPPKWPENLPYFQEFNFKSCILLYTQVKERTGLLHIHLNKTEGRYPKVTLIDPSGVHHTVDLDQTEFVIQEKGELLIPHFQRLASLGEKEIAKKSVDELLACLMTFYRKGIKDFDKSIRKNFGFVEGKAITLDISSFGLDPSLKIPEEGKKEILLKTRRLARWLKKHQPDLYDYYETRIQEL